MRGRREKWLQVRLDESEHLMATRLAEDYGMDVSSFVRAMLFYFDEHQPVLMIPPVGKGFALTTCQTLLSASSRTLMRRSIAAMT